MIRVCCADRLIRSYHEDPVLPSLTYMSSAIKTILMFWLTKGIICALVRGVTGYRNLGGQVVMQGAATAWLRLLFYQKRDGQLLILPTRHLRPMFSLFRFNLFYFSFSVDATMNRKFNFVSLFSAEMIKSTLNSEFL